MDALSELAYDQTPYHFGFNNPVFWSDPTGLFAQYFQAVIFALSLDGNSTITYNGGLAGWVVTVEGGKFDGASFYNYEATGTIMDEMIIPASRGGGGSSNSSNLLGYVNNGIDGFGSYLHKRNSSQGGSFRLFKNLKDGKVWAPKYYSNNFGARGKGKHNIYNVSKTITKGTIYTSAILEVPDIVDGIKADQGIGRNTVTQTAGAVGSVWGGIYLGGKGGAAFGSLFGGHPAAIGVGTVIGGVAGGMVGEATAEFLIESIPSSNYNGPVIQNKR